MSLAPLEDLLVDWATAELIAEAEAPACDWLLVAKAECDQPATFRVGIRHVNGRPCPSVTPFAICDKHTEEVRHYASEMVHLGNVRCGECKEPIQTVSDALAYVLPLS